MNDITTLLGAVNLLLVIAAAIGGFFGFRNSRKSTIITIQNETIQALQDQINALKDKVEELIRENASQRTIVETIKSALKQRGILVTIDGDLVTISDGNTTSHALHKASTPPVAKPALRPKTIKKEESNG